MIPTDSMQNQKGEIKNIQKTLKYKNLDVTQFY